MCPTGIQLEAAWRSASTQIRAAPGTNAGAYMTDELLSEFKLPEPIQDTLKRERERVEYQTALENYRQHIKSCSICRPEREVYFPY